MTLAGTWRPELCPPSWVAYLLAAIFSSFARPCFQHVRPMLYWRPGLSIANKPRCTTYSPAAPSSSSERPLLDPTEGPPQVAVTETFAKLL
ncbi:hypothetical protein BDW74DRAFT_141619 [Aspergillus multicolor]|uniref:uncharacterized protein n=1 Tax=Aspergillus multicolor TaxID=41759 RepID=UPI003CCC96CC